MTESNQDNRGSNKKNLRAFLNVAGVIVIFLFGIAIGSGRIAWGADSVFHRSIAGNNNSADIDFDGIKELYSALKESYDGQVDASKIEDGLKEGLVSAAGDPYTEYMNDQDSKEFQGELNGTFDGIGAELGKKDNTVVIIAPIDGFPAQKAGVRAGDVISKIDDESAYDISVSEAVKKIRGPKGTTVKLELIRDGKPVTIEITRDTINIPSVKSEVTSDNIGIIRISRFGDDTTKLVNQYATEFKSKNVRGVVLDMRGNPGGLLSAAVDVSSIWLPKGKTVLEEKRDGKTIKTYTATGNSVLLGVPTVVLIDEGSASASEITAGALRDNGVATLIGQKSYGKGSVQEIRNLKDGGTLKVTIARWFTPNGRNIDKEGIEPDQKVELTDEDILAGRDPQKDAALNKLR